MVGVLAFHTHGLLTKREVKIAEYWPSFFLRVYGPKIFDLAGPSKKSRAASIAPSCPLG